MAFEHLEEYCWERDDSNMWRYVDGAEFCARLRVEREEEEKIIDQWTGAELKPGDPEHCQGNGEDPRFECCCDECDYLIQCAAVWGDETCVELLKELQSDDNSCTTP